MWKLRIGILLGLGCSFSGFAWGALTTITVSMNTSALVSDTADQPFAFEFDLEPGALIPSDARSAFTTFQAPPPPLGNPSNIVTLSNFSFGGGSAADPSTDPAFFTLGGVTGDIRSTVIIGGTAPDNYLSQSFTPGSQLSFVIAYTNNQSDSGIPDSFDFAILDSNGVEIPTQGSDIFPSFLVITFNGDVPEVDTYASDPTTPTSAGAVLDIAAPTAETLTPEPGTFGILGLGLFCLAGLAFRRKIGASVRRAGPGAVLAAALFFAALGSRGLMAQLPAPTEFFTGTWHGNPVTYQVINGFAVTEGDMIIGEASTTTEPGGRRTALLRGSLPESNSVNLSSNLWPKVAGVVTIPYNVTVGTPNVTAAIAAFNTLFAGQFQWVPKKPDQKDYVDIDLENQSMNSCYATLGYTTGKESIQGAVGCNVSALLHEMGHIMGFAHEQSRANRNSYLNIDFPNIAPASQSQYTQNLSTTMDLGLYDYSSLMHYGPRGFTRNGNPEMESIPVGIPFGDPPTYSRGDIDALNRLYFTPPSMVTVTSNPAGLQIIVDGATYTAPQSFSWALNSTHTLNVPPGPQTVGGAGYIFGRWNSDLNADLNPSRTIVVTPGSGMLGSPSSAPAYTVYSVNYIQLAQYNPVPVLDNFLSTTAAAGSVAVTPAPTTYAGLTGQYFVSRQLVTLTATPAPGNSFYGYGSGSTGFVQTFGLATNPLTIPSDNLAGSFYINFASQPAVTIGTNVTNNAGGASVTADGAGMKSLAASWALATDAGWGAGTTHSLTAASPVSPFFDPNTQYTFSGWTDGITTATRSIVVPGLRPSIPRR